MRVYSCSGRASNVRLTALFNYLTIVMRPFFFLFLLTSTAPLRADALAARLRLLLPGEEAGVVNERQYLYQRVSGLFRELDGKRAGRKSIRKRVGRIVSHLEDNYFKTYDGGADLADAFRRNRYNDATAAVLTALALEQYDVDYYVLVDHWESHLLADPRGKKIALRHPKAKKRKEKREIAFRANFVELVRATVAEDLSVRSRKQIDAAFSTYYYDPDKLLTFGQLSAYALYRKAQAAYRTDNFQRAVDLAKKASARENRPAFLVLRRAAEFQLAALAPKAVTGDIGKFYRQWTEDPNNTYLPAAILNHFDEQQQLLLAQDHPDLARTLLDDYVARAPAGSAAWEQELTILQRYRLVNHYYANGQLDLAKREAEALYADDPTNETVRYILGEIVIGSLRRTPARGESFQRAVQSAAERYPFIRKQDRFADLLLRELAWKVRDLYAVDRAAEATSALEHFRTALVDIPIGRERSLWTLTAFYAASDFYFRQQDYARARRYVAEALTYTPDDQFLLHRQDLLGRY